MNEIIIWWWYVAPATVFLSLFLPALFDDGGWFGGLPGAILMFIVWGFVLGVSIGKWLA